MDDRVSQFLAQAKNIRLSPDEQNFMRESLVAFVNATQNFGALLTPESLALEDDEKMKIRLRIVEHLNAHPAHASRDGFFSHLSLLFRFAAFAAFVLVFTAGTSFAAESSIPGDMLYPFKRYVNEPVMSALARSPQAKMELSVALLERRISEVEAVAVVRPERVAYAEANVKAQSDDLDTRVSAMDSTDDAADIRMSVRYALQERLNEATETKGDITRDTAQRIVRSVINKFDEPVQVNAMAKAKAKASAATLSVTAEDSTTASAPAAGESSPKREVPVRIRALLRKNSVRRATRASSDVASSAASSVVQTSSQASSPSKVDRSGSTDDADVEEEREEKTRKPHLRPIPPLPPLIIKGQ